jgi:integrase
MTNRKCREYLSMAELAAVLTYVRTRAGRARRKGAARAVVDELIVMLLAGAGLRSHDLITLRIKDLPETHGEMALWIRNTNSGVARKVNIDKDLTELLARFVRFYRNGAQADDLLVVSERDGPLKYISLYSKVRRIGREAGVG